MQKNDTSPTFAVSNFYPMTLQEVGQEIKKARNAKGWNQQDLADAAELSQATISDIESGKTKAGRDSRVKVLLVLGLQLDIQTPTDEEISAYKDSLGDNDQEKGD